VRVATFNLHAGVDGWGRATSAYEHAVSLRSDILICPEIWRGDNGPDFFADFETDLSMKGAFAPLTRAERVSTGTGKKSWQPLLAHFSAERGLYYREVRDLKKIQIKNRQNVTLEPGTWGLGLLTRFEIEEINVESLGRLPREKVNRALIIAKLRDQGKSFYVIAVHGAHLSHGSYLQYRRISAIVRLLDPSLPVLIAGDFNCWRPLLRVLLPGWTTLIRARTYPARIPHSQIDHILGRGPWKKLGGGASNGGSDHRALVAEVELR
jgi:endonuclease/exonuclease/phosphatase family metal-dependent hydrolase